MQFITVTLLSMALASATAIPGFKVQPGSTPLPGSLDDHSRDGKDQYRHLPGVAKYPQQNGGAPIRIRKERPAPRRTVSLDGAPVVAEDSDSDSEDLPAGMVNMAPSSSLLPPPVATPTDSADVTVQLLDRRGGRQFRLKVPADGPGEISNRFVTVAGDTMGLDQGHGHFQGSLTNGNSGELISTSGGQVFIKSWGGTPMERVFIGNPGGSAKSHWTISAAGGQDFLANGGAHNPDTKSFVTCGPAHAILYGSMGIGAGGSGRCTAPFRLEVVY